MTRQMWWTADPGNTRHEFKFVASETDYHVILSWLKLQAPGFRRAYPPRRVNNVYFDRIDYDAYGESVAGTSARVKVRYRWYGKTPYPAAGRLEVKLRQNRVGRKLRYPVDTLDGSMQDWVTVKRRILDALPSDGRGWLLEYSNPLITNHYERDYWVSSDGVIRATLDRDQVVYDQRYAQTPNTSRRALLDRTMVLEVKCAVQDAETVSRLVSTLRLPLSRHSKYCNAVKAVAGY